MPGFNAADPESTDVANHHPGTQSTGLPTEARQVSRRNYPFQQRYALFREGRWPEEDEFQLAEMCDISARGLALLLRDRPAADQVVVELGVGANVSQLLAQIVQITPAEVAGQPGFRVGCEFVSARRKS